MPEAFQLAVTTSLHKKGDRRLVDNYRPVVQLSIACNTIERLVAEHLVGSLSSVGLLDSEQNGSFKLPSTETQLLEITEDRD